METMTATLPETAPAPRHREAAPTPHHTEHLHSVVMGETEVVQHPGCTEYRAWAYTTLNGKPFNTLDLITVTVSHRAEEMRVFGKAAIAGVIGHAEGAPGDEQAAVQDMQQALCRNLESRVTPVMQS